MMVVEHKIENPVLERRMRFAHIQAYKLKQVDQCRPENGNGAKGDPD